MNLRNYGFFDGDIESLLQICPWIVMDRTCIVTTLDSGNDTAAAMGRRLRNHKIQSLGRFAVMPGDILVENRSQIFHGFDEVFVLRKGVDCDSVPVDALFVQNTSDRTHLISEVPGNLMSLLTVWHAERYFSDGSGLNIMVENSSILGEIAGALSRGFFPQRE